MLYTHFDAAIVWLVRMVCMVVMSFPPVQLFKQCAFWVEVPAIIIYELRKCLSIDVCSCIMLFFSVFLPKNKQPSNIPKTFKLRNATLEIALWTRLILPKNVFMWPLSDVIYMLLYKLVSKTAHLRFWGGNWGWTYLCLSSNIHWYTALWSSSIWQSVMSCCTIAVTMSGKTSSSMSNITEPESNIEIGLQKCYEKVHQVHQSIAYNFPFKNKCVHNLWLGDEQI